MRAFIGVILFLFIIAIVLLFTASAAPVVVLPDALTAIGQATPILVKIADPHGVRQATAYIEQNGERYKVAGVEHPSRRFTWLRGQPDETLRFTVGVKSTPQLKDGSARLIVEATSNDFRRATAEAARDVTIATHPVTVSVDSDQHYLYVGMADLVTYNVSGYATASGVRVGDETFRGWPMPGGKPGQFSLFAFSWNMPLNTLPMVYAIGPGGDEAHGRMIIQFAKREQPRYRVRDLQIDDKFMQKVVNELDPNGSGDMETRFVRINSEMRKANNQVLADLKTKTEPKFLWSQPFQQQPNTKVEANFADVRNYIYQGKKIDQQTHLGYDLSSTQHVGVQASNDGRVVYAAPLGIYGNCIVVDHGYGLQTIYGHLSEIDVHEGDMVKRGQVMGKSGMTGMAGGDHIHFSMQLEGVQIDPKEWWDAHWIKDHIARRIELPGFTG
ncbi:MAG TPA: M23 family metallopeptidase [Terriglobales bacterium]|nr:M23 family metallopeptidase [Terriglobales bacterium]